MPMNRRTSYVVLAVLVGCVVGVLDQLSKHWVLAAYEGMQIPRPVMGGLNWVLVWNRGMSFGVLNHDVWWGPWVLGTVACVLLVILARWLWAATHALQALALGLIMGGALGNIVDRVLHGAVVDFIDMYWQQYHWPAFNVADSAICVGVVLLVLESIVHPNQTMPKHPQEQADDA
jgi:signal peptidase II